MMNGYSPLEHIARMMGNVVRYDEKGNPSIFVRFPKVKSSDFDPLLPEQTHPAFIVNGEEEDAILLGKFKSTELSEDSGLYALPNMPPCISTSHDDALARMRALGHGASGLTIADHGFLLLLTYKNGWDQRGNDNCGCSAFVAQRWSLGMDFDVGDVCSRDGWLYECLIAHEADEAFEPGVDPMHWKRLRHAGGVPISHGDMRTLNGTGPMDWYLGGDVGSLCDVIGNCYEAVYGVRLVGCEIQILANNNAADAGADLSVNGAWRAILPSGEDGSYTLVEPGTPGTVHYGYASSADTGNVITLDTVPPVLDGKRHSGYFTQLVVNSANLPHVPSILYELGLAPLPGMAGCDHLRGELAIVATQEERLAYRSDNATNSMMTGMCSLLFTGTRNGKNGSRPRGRV